MCRVPLPADNSLRIHDMQTTFRQERGKKWRGMKFLTSGNRGFVCLPGLGSRAGNGQILTDCPHAEPPLPPASSLQASCLLNKTFHHFPPFCLSPCSPCSYISIFELDTYTKDEDVFMCEAREGPRVDYLPTTNAEKEYE